ncbi:alpha/beta hydrolase [Iningainema sp. BLCCT55]|uniref:Alpha/beta hydrolase n=2 Tax=Iningainema TaxID=1932705 RepID=A0A8J6XMK1_9CYAN|nr:alpha/beta hydrolase [Iningainema tapete BLCC-T55]
MNLKTRAEWSSKSLAEKMELWDKIEKNIQQKSNIEQEKEQEISNLINNKVKLSFIGHSMGCFVVTNVIRTLSDVFDPSALNQTTSEIGHSFCLCRLVLVAPDIPVESIMPGRANFLSHSLRRCQEAYVFSNEGDLALRLASTAANYFVFPAKTRFSGYKLGNLTSLRFQNKYDESNKLIPEQEYGIVNLKEGNIDSPYKYLEVRASNLEHRNLCELEYTKLCETIPGSIDKDDIQVSDLFTYFDCTDYTDVKDYVATGLQNVQSQGIVSYALKKSSLNFPDYFRLGLAYFVYKGAKNIDTHGGYFDGKFSQKAIYEIAFLGFKGFLLSYLSNSQLKSRGSQQFDGLPLNEREKLLKDFSDDCKSKGIQVVLSPKRYKEIK